MTLEWMIAQGYLIPYLASNLIALALLAASFRRPTWVRWASVIIFAWAAWTNAKLALTNPVEYQGFAELALTDPYRRFILGWFRDHTAWLVLPIALGQLSISALLLLNAGWSRSLGCAGAVAFLLAIAPLGVGSALPFSFAYGAALVVMWHRLGRSEKVEAEGQVA